MNSMHGWTPQDIVALVIAITGLVTAFNARTKVNSINGSVAHVQDDVNALAVEHAVHTEQIKTLQETAP